MTLRTLIFLVVAAMLEVGGDALIRSGLHRRGVLLVFRERLDRSVIAGGSLVVLGGIVMTVFRG